ncbi:MAG: serine/threonine-protein phosphatase [Clostridia bacterium]|nr:serine/threonine-protein phosphatase [Clostridia bacterium]
MLVYAKTDIGKAREMNQDFYYVSEERNGMRLCILADGMGGYKGGEIASSLATASARHFIEEKFDEIEPTKENIKNLIKEAMDYANKIVYKKSKENEELEQMGTTLEICIMYGNKVYMGHIGDSRIYRIRKNIIRRITTDHSYVETLVKDGTITREEAFYHPRKNMLMKAIRMRGKY